MAQMVLYYGKLPRTKSAMSEIVCVKQSEMAHTLLIFTRN